MNDICHDSSDSKGDNSSDVILQGLLELVLSPGSLVAIAYHLRDNMTPDTVHKVAQDVTDTITSIISKVI